LDLERNLGKEIAALSALHPGGIAVRVHVLGDFYSLDYLESWWRWMGQFPGLHAWGYTAHPADSVIGCIVLLGNSVFPGRWAFRTSVSPETDPGEWQATTIWRQPEGSTVAEGLVCPAQTEGTQACATCGLCWSPEAAGKRIVFIGHGMRRGRRGKHQVPNNLVAKSIEFVGGSKKVAAGLNLGLQTVLRWRETGHVPKFQASRFWALVLKLSEADGLARSAPTAVGSQT
jgi:hypothetical protein